MFRDNFLELLDKKYVFYAVWPKETEESFVNAHFRTLVGKFFKPVGFKCLILALENISEKTDKDAEKAELENIKKMWTEIEHDCEWFHVSPKDIFPIKQENLPQAIFPKDDFYFDEIKFGFFVKRETFESAKIGEEHCISSEIDGHKLDGNVLGDIDLERIKKKQSPLDEYYFLPCK